MHGLKAKFACVLYRACQALFEGKVCLCYILAMDHVVIVTTAMIYLILIHLKQRREIFTISLRYLRKSFKFLPQAPTLFFRT